MQQVELRADEGRGVPVAGPACYGDHVEGLVEEGSECGQGGENEGMRGVEGEV